MTEMERLEKVMSETNKLLATLEYEERCETEMLQDLMFCAVADGDIKMGTSLDKAMQILCNK